MKQPDIVLSSVTCKSKFRFCRIELLRDGRYWTTLSDRSHTVLTMCLKPEQFDVLASTIDRFRSEVIDRLSGDSVSHCPVPGSRPAALDN